MSLVITIGRSSLKTRIAAIMASGSPIRPRSAGVSRTIDRTTTAQPIHVQACQTAEKRLGRHKEGWAGTGEDNSEHLPSLCAEPTGGARQRSC